MLILGIETSCDETAISIIKAQKNEVAVLSNVVSSQVKLHAKWGGVVPSLAAREHLKNIGPVFQSALKEAEVSMKDINLISVTNGPGLIPALLIGTNFARAVAYAFEKPLLGVHHIEGHIYANFISDEISANPKSKIQNPKISFPILALVVSGGHTQLILMKDHLQYEIIGETLDDAAGEAFDKVARMLGIGYPGGPAVATAAEKYRLDAEKRRKLQQNSTLISQDSALRLPRPMINSKNFNFSFSGLKTAVLYELKKHSHILKNVRMSSVMCAEFQQAVIDVLVHKTIQAAKLYDPKTILLAGGVSANFELRKQLGEAIQKELKNVYYIIPDIKYSVDNSAMIAAAGYFRYQKMTAAQRKKLNDSWKNLQADANLKLS